MDSFQLIYSFLLLVLILFKDVSSLTLSVSPRSGKAILGDNPFTLSCTYTLGQNEQLFTIELKRKRETESDYTTIVTYFSPSSPLNVTYQDTSLESRTVATKLTESTRTATLVFNTVECDDKATYMWDAFYSDGTNSHVTETSVVTVKAVTLFSQDGRISYNPQTNIEEGDKVVFTCSGDVGNEPVGYLGWFYYLGNNTSNAINASNQATSTAPAYQASTCSFTRTSTLQLTMTPEFNDLLVRCTAQQEDFTQFGEAYSQTKNIPVYYSPRVTAIADRNVDEGTELLTLTCNADAYPAPNYSWLLPNGTETSGPILMLTNLQVGDNGTYTCVVYNTYKNLNHTRNETLYLDVRKTTTPPPTTTTPQSTGSTGESQGTTKAAPVTGGDDDKTTIIIVVVVVVGLLIIIGIVVIILCVKKRSKPKEIEEPPEKPRNNQDLSFYGNRPDLVSADHGMKNNMGSSALNSSFNNSFDSSSDVKQRNEDGLLYIDLQFDDKPRSRRPIQILDNGSTPYADIVNPRV